MISESGLEINLETFSSETQVRKTHEYPLEVNRLGLSRDPDKTCSDASLGLLLADPSW